MAFSMFHAPKPRKFNYTPRYFDPNQEALEKKKAAMGLDSKLSEQEKRRMRIRTGFGYSPEDFQEKRSKVGFKGMRYVVFFGVLVLLVYIIFGTPMLENFFEMFFKLGKQ